MSVEDIEKIRRAIGIKVNSPAADYLGNILAYYEKEAAEQKRWAKTAKGTKAFQTLRKRLSDDAHRVLIAAGLVKTFGKDWDNVALGLHDDLLKFADMAEHFADTISARGGKGNLYSRFHGPPEWRLAINLAALYRSRNPTPKGTLYKFTENVYSPIVESIREQNIGQGQMESEFAKRAYTIAGKALPINDRIRTIGDELRQSEAISTQKHAVLVRELTVLQQELRLLNEKAPYPFLIGRQPGV